jgi:hypothetical protein
LTGTAGITGSSSPAAEVEGWALNWHALSNPATARAGYHTLALKMLKMGDEHEGDLAVPQGSGFGSFRATPGGSLRLGGRLADGASLTHASALGPDGQIRVFALLYGRPVPGSLWGRIDQDPGDDPVSPADNRLTGALSWSRPNRLPRGGLVYPGGLGPVTVNVEGGAYAPPHSCWARPDPAAESASLSPEPISPSRIPPCNRSPCSLM